MRASKYLKIKAKQKTIKRSELIELIYEYASDELVTISDCIKLAKMNKKQLKLELLSIGEYYKRNE